MKTILFIVLCVLPTAALVHKFGWDYRLRHRSFSDLYLHPGNWIELLCEATAYMVVYSVCVHVRCLVTLDLLQYIVHVTNINSRILVMCM